MFKRIWAAIKATAKGLFDTARGFLTAMGMGLTAPVALPLAGVITGAAVGSSLSPHLPAAGMVFGGIVGMASGWLAVVPTKFLSTTAATMILIGGVVTSLLNGAGVLFDLEPMPLPHAQAAEAAQDLWDELGGLSPEPTTKEEAAPAAA